MVGLARRGQESITGHVIDIQREKVNIITVVAYNSSRHSLEGERFDSCGLQDIGDGRARTTYISNAEDSVETVERLKRLSEVCKEEK